MTRDAQQAADAAMAEIKGLETLDMPGYVVVREGWLRAFLTDLHECWTAEIGGEQAEGRHSTGNARSASNADPSSPATPIDTEALAEAIKSMEKAATYFDKAIWNSELDNPYGVHPLGDSLKARAWRDGINAIRRFLGEAVGGQPVEVCEWKQDNLGVWITACSKFSDPVVKGSSCPYCGKPIREVPFEEASDEQG